MVPLQLKGSLSNKSPVSLALIQNRCLGSPANYCFPYYFPESYRLHLQMNPLLLS